MQPSLRKEIHFEMIQTSDNTRKPLSFAHTINYTHPFVQTFMILQFACVGSKVIQYKLFTISRASAYTRQCGVMLMLNVPNGGSIRDLI